MLILFFDTETTGIPKNWNAPLNDLNNWPRLVQLAFKVFDENRTLIQEVDYTIKPDGFEIPIEATHIHGISTEYASEYGVPLSDALNSFLISLSVSDYVVAHNMTYDESIIGSEYIRIGKINYLSNSNKICTMKSSVEFCKIEGIRNFKYPKLTELYFKLFNKIIEEKHNALYDVDVTATCFWKLLQLKVITLSLKNNNIEKHTFNMSIKTKTEWLKGFLEAIELNDSISKKQIQMLKEKLDDLLLAVEELKKTENYYETDDLPF